MTLTQTVSDQLQSLEPNRLSLEDFKVDSKLDQRCGRVMRVSDCKIAVTAQEATYALAARFCTGAAGVVVVNADIESSFKSLAAKAFSFLFGHTQFERFEGQSIFAGKVCEPLFRRILLAGFDFSQRGIALISMVVASFAGCIPTTFASWRYAEIIGRFNEFALAATLFGYSCVNGVSRTGFVAASFAYALIAVFAVCAFLRTEIADWFNDFTRTATSFGDGGCRIEHVGLPISSAIPPVCVSRRGGLTHSTERADTQSNVLLCESFRLTCFGAGDLR